MIMYDLGLGQFGVIPRIEITLDEYNKYMDGGYKNPNDPIEKYRLSEVDTLIMICNDMIDLHKDDVDEVNEIKSLISKLEDYRIHPEKYFDYEPSIEDLHFNSN